MTTMNDNPPDEGMSTADLAALMQQYAEKSGKLDALLDIAMKALEPFADMADDFEEERPGHTLIQGRKDTIRVSQLRKAREAVDYVKRLRG